MPEWTPAKIAVASVLLVFVLVLIVNFAPEQSTRNYSATDVQVSNFEFSELNLSAYDGMRLTLSEPAGTRELYGVISTRSSPDGGAVVNGNIKNISDSELFLTSDRTGALQRDNPIGVTMLVNDGIQRHRAELEIKDSQLWINNDNITGYYIKPNEKLSFKIIEPKVHIEPTKTESLDIRWLVIDPDSLEQFPVMIPLELKQTGKSLVWGETEIYWRRQTPIRR